jgi:hypothetical protein
LHLANDAVFPLAVGGPIYEQDSGQGLLLLREDSLLNLRVVVVHHVLQVFNWQLGITDYKLLAVVINHYRYVE